MLGWGIAVVAALIFAGQLDGALAVLARVVPVLGLLVGTPLVPAAALAALALGGAAGGDRHPPRHVHDPPHAGPDAARAARRHHARPVEQSLDLATVVVHTAAGSHTIPLLTERDAAELRDRIADLARTADEP